MSTVSIPVIVLTQTSEDRRTKGVTLNAMKGLTVGCIAEFILSAAEGLSLTGLDSTAYGVPMCCILV